MISMKEMLIVVGGESDGVLEGPQVDPGGRRVV